MSVTKAGRFYDLLSRTECYRNDRVEEKLCDREMMPRHSGGSEYGSKEC